MLHTFPYRLFPSLELPEENVAGVYTLPRSAITANDVDLIRLALAAPIGCGRLRDQVTPGMKIDIAVDDNNRNTRTDLMLPLVLEEIEAARIPREDITIFVALGTHRPMRLEELLTKLTEQVVLNYKIVNPNWKDPSAYKISHKTTHGSEIRIHKEILSADYVIGVGQTIPHVLAGFSGGGKIINPGCADKQTIGEIHWLCSEVPEGQLFAVRDNVVREVIDEVALKVGLKFILNEVPGGDGSFAGAFAGDPIEAHRAACICAANACKVEIEEQTEIVIADAYPADLDFWQALKGLNAAYGAVKDGGTVILVSPCPEGASSEHPELTKMGYIPVEQTKRMVAEGKLGKVVAGNFYLGRKLLDRANAILVTEGIREKDTIAMGFGWAPNPQVALEIAMSAYDKTAKINVLFKAGKMVCCLK